MNQTSRMFRALALASVAVLLLALPLGAGAATVIGSVTQTDHTLSSDVTYDSVQMLDFDATYPDFGSANQPVLKDIDKAYADKAFSFYASMPNTLVKSAIEDYKSSLKEEYPFRMYGADMKTTVVFNADSILSTYTDQYTYTGGAHGNTVRTSDTWNLATGHRVRLKNLFKKGPSYRAVILDKILKLADKQMETEQGLFDDYRALIKKSFNVDSFYLTPTGVAFYFQQYDIAPYAAGFVTFEIPYGELGIQLSYKTLP